MTVILFSESVILVEHFDDRENIRKRENPPPKPPRIT